MNSILACKLIETVVSLTLAREKYASLGEQLSLVNQDLLGTLEPRLKDLLYQDSEEFDKVISARRKRDQETDPKKKKTLQKTALRVLESATDIPMQIAELSLKVAEKALIVFDLGFKSARGDSAVALSSATSGAFGALSVVYLNLTSFRSGSWALKTKTKADGLRREAEKMQSELYNRLNQLQGEPPVDSVITT